VSGRNLMGLCAATVAAVIAANNLEATWLWNAQDHQSLGRPFPLEKGPTAGH
jgi:hypothetical protein